MSQPSDDPFGARPPQAAGAPGRTSVSALNAAAIVVAALFFGRDLFVPLVLAVLLAFVLAPLVTLLQRARLGRVPAVLIAVALASVVIAGIGLVVGRQATMLAKSLPDYRAIIEQKTQSLAVGSALIDHFNGSLGSFLGSLADGGTAPNSGEPQAGASTAQGPAASERAGDFSAYSALVIARTFVQPLFSPLATFGAVIVFAIFVLLYREDLRDRLVRLVGRQDLHRTILAMNDAAKRLSRFFLFQLMLNTGFGVFIAAGLWLANLPNPVLWGILATLMRFVPFIGSVIAAVPPLLLAIAVVPGWSLALIVLALFVLSELIMGQVIEPLLYSHSTGLSPIAVILSAAFWAFLWGPVGLLLATPVTVCLVVIGRHVEALTFLDVIFGDSPPLEPAETFYQRALEGNAKQLVAQARKAISKASLADYYDDVAIRGLALAQVDLARDALASERLEAVHQHIEALLASLQGLRLSTASRPDATAQPPAWRDSGAVICVPGRGQLDDLAAEMATQVLQDAGFGARFASGAILGNGRPGAEDHGGARLCCLSVLEQGNSPSGVRYLFRRMQRRMPNAAIVVCLWHATSDSLMLKTLRLESDEITIVLSLGELIAFAKAISARQAALMMEVR